ncbi:MAG: DNA cytosine methyltransferase [Segniliparus sp.]|uniref:DNA cytosine methyltransferase n=1 Tax=Segniliparus sp. TaxID=2804064 RepID=UPI003F2A3E7E
MVTQLSAVGLFAGIGGIEQGLAQAGIRSELLCEIDSGAVAVLRRHMPEVPLAPDVQTIESIPKVDVVAAGFPCQDLSQAGRTAGITGARSGLVEHVFRLVRKPANGPKWLLLENVPFMLQLDRGKAMRYLTTTLEELGFTWAYRVVDTRAFGLPQRRLRVVLLASRTEDPRAVLFADNATPREPADPAKHACGFYWTEGTRGLGWAVNAVPTLKAGSTIGIASPPAIRLIKDRSLVTPSIEDAERLQGFPAGWTAPSVEDARTRKGHRWKLVGNAVSVPMAKWVGTRLVAPADHDPTRDTPLPSGAIWPDAAWGSNGSASRVDLTQWPVRQSYQHLEKFIQAPKPLSFRATAGFLKRAENSSLRFADGFLADVRTHLTRIEASQAV